MKNDPPAIVRRTFNFALRITRLCTVLIESNSVGKTFGYQLLRCGPQIGAFVEEAQGAPDRAEFARRMSLALKEARQTFYWLRLLSAAEMIKNNQLEPLLQEAEEITKIVGAITASTYRSMD
jgi:four helix bundle protein